MHEEKEIKIIPIKIGTGDKSKELKFVCMPHILESDPIIKTYLDGQKMKLNFSPAKISPEKFSKFDDDETVTASFKELDEMDHNGGSKSPTKQQKFVYNSKFGRINGVKPKFVRAREIHKYLFYLTRDYRLLILRKSFFVHDFI